jgi:flagellar basal-body rod protein FlgC
MDTATSVSGLRAAEARIAVSANNVANINSTKKLENGVEKNELFVPKTVQDVSVGTSGGVKSVASPVQPANFLQTNAKVEGDEGSLPFRSTVDLAKETTDTVVAKNAYQANLIALEAKNKTIEQTLDIIS